MRERAGILLLHLLLRSPAIAQDPAGAPFAGISSVPPPDLGVQRCAMKEHRAARQIPANTTRSICSPSLPSSAPVARMSPKSQGTAIAVFSFLVLNEIKNTKTQENSHFQAFFQDSLTRQLPKAYQLFILRDSRYRLITFSSRL